MPTLTVLNLIYLLFEFESILIWVGIFTVFHKHFKFLAFLLKFNHILDLFSIVYFVYLVGLCQQLSQLPFHHNILFSNLFKLLSYIYLLVHHNRWMTTCSCCQSFMRLWGKINNLHHRFKFKEK